MAQLRENEKAARPCLACRGGGDLADSPYRHVIGDRPKDHRACPACRGSGRRPDLVDMSLQRHLVAVLELNGERRRHTWRLITVTPVADWSAGENKDQAMATPGHETWHLFSEEDYQQSLAMQLFIPFLTTEPLRAAGWKIERLEIHLEVTGPNDYVIEGDWYDAYNHALAGKRARRKEQ